MGDFKKAYQNLLIQQFANKEKAKKNVEILIDGYEEIYNVLNLMFVSFKLEDAVGQQLDILGKILGISRKTEFKTIKRFFGFAQNENSYPFNLNNETKYPFYRNEKLTQDNQLDDINFRMFIKAKIIKNNVKAVMIDPDNKLSMQNAIDFLFSGKAYVVDNYNMTMTIYIDRSYDINLLQYLKTANLVPKPQGVKISTIIGYADGKTFGFTDVNPNAQSFNNGANGVEFAIDLKLD